MAAAVVTSTSGGERSSATTTVMYGSAEPPMLVVSLSKASTTLRLVTASAHFAVSVLSSDQRGVAVAAGTHMAGADKFDVANIETMTTGPAAGLGIPGALAVLVGELAGTFSAGDHRCCVGEVRHAELGPDELEPLARVRRAYMAVPPGEAMGRTYPI